MQRDKAFLRDSEGSCYIIFTKLTKPRFVLKYLVIQQEVKVILFITRRENRSSHPV
jgi:hypothetical protein